MVNLVKKYDDDLRVSTFDIYSQLGYNEHRKLKTVISKNKSAFDNYGLLPLERQKPTKGSIGGRPDESYLLNENQFILLVMLCKNTEASVSLKIRICDEFVRMRNKLAKMTNTTDYMKVRNDGKKVYHQKTDVVKQFVDYATNQGCSSSKFYYANLATMENKALFIIDQKYPNVREVLNIRQLMQVAVADQIIEKALLDGMDANMSYSDVYLLAKERIIEFSNVIGQSLINLDEVVIQKKLN